MSKLLGIILMSAILLGGMTEARLEFPSKAEAGMPLPPDPKDYAKKDEASKWFVRELKRNRSRHRAQMQTCYDKQQKLNPSFATIIDIHFDIEAAGKVRTSTVSSSQILERESQDPFMQDPFILTSRPFQVPRQTA